LSYEALKMKGKFKDRATPLITSAIKSACSSLSITHGPAIRKRSPDPTRTLSIWKDELKVRFPRTKPSISPQRHRGTEEICQEGILSVPLCLRGRFSVRATSYLRAGRKNISTSAASFCTFRFLPYSYAAPMKVRNSGCGSSGFDLNSGWNWHPIKCGCSGISTIST